MEDLRAVVGRNIRALRLRKSWTLEELAFRCGLHANYLGDAERGRRNLSMASLGKIARGLDVEPGELLRGAKKAPAPHEDKTYSAARKFADLVRDRSEDERQVLYRILKEASRGLRSSK